MAILHKSRLLIGPVLFLAVAFGNEPAFSQTPPASQTAGGIVREETQRFRQKRLEERIESEKAKTEDAGPTGTVTPDQGPKTLVSKITVEGSTLLSEDEIRAIVSPYEGKELSLETIQKIADLITDEYRKKGFVTSRAYIPPQKILNGQLIIKVVEGKLGKVDIKGNRYFSTSLLRKKIGIRQEGYFDYSSLQNSLVYINEHPDRLAKAILVPGTEPGTTDIILEVQDNFPFHIEFSYDNYGSRYIENDRYAIAIEHNNLTGHDDKFYAKGLLSQGDHLVLQQFRYSYPLSQKWELGGYALLNKTQLGREFKELRSRGEAEIFGMYSNFKWIREETMDVGLNLGFDSKNIYNELSGSQLSRDELRVVKAGFDIDSIDHWGRTILTAELNQGIPEFLGSMDAKDADASRTGAGGKFTKEVFNLFRLQPMFLNTSALLKNTFQLSNNTLAASEQFQIGGATSVRGYPSGEYSGDNGFYSAVEWSIPLYGLSKNIKVPLREERLYDVFRFVLFWDIGFVNINHPQPGERENQTLRSAGFGARFTMPEDLEVRIETGYPLGGPNPSDGKQAHSWIEAHVKF